MARESASDHGYITAAVLAFTGVVAAIVSAVLLASVPTWGYARISAQETVATGLLDGGLQFVGYELFTAKKDASRLNSAVLRLGTGTSSFSIRDEAARIDLNSADADLLAGLYAAVGNRMLTPAMFAARVIDWRDPDDDEGEGGAETERYVSEGSGVLPRNAPFRSTADLAFVLGLPPGEVDRLLPFTTVFNPAGGIDPLAASNVVLAALPDLSPVDRENVRKAQRIPGADRDMVLAATGAPSRYFQRTPSGIYRVTIRARLPNNYTSTAEAVIMKASGKNRDYSVLAWSRLYEN